MYNRLQPQARAHLQFLPEFLK